LAVLSLNITLFANFSQAENNSNPTISILEPTNGTVYFKYGPSYIVLFQLKYQTSGEISWVGYSFNGGENVTAIGNATDIFDADAGYHYLTVFANDTNGNWAAPQTITWVIQKEYETYSLWTIIVITVVTLVVLTAIILLYRKHRKNKR
jgi:hypothetical protein